MDLSRSMASRQSCVPCTSGRPLWCIPRVAYASRPQGHIRPPFQTFSSTSRLLTTHAAGEGATSAAADSPAAAAAADDDDEDWVEVGVVGPPHGVRGEFKVQPLTDFPEERLGEPGPRWLRAPPPKMGRPSAPPEPEEFELEWGRMSVYKGREVWIVKLEEIDSPEEATLIRGHVLLIPAAARAPLADSDEFYVQDLVGLRVVMDESGEEVGTVIDIFDGTGTHDVMRIEVSPTSSIGAGGGSREADEEGSEEGSGGDDDGASHAAPAAPRQVLLPFVKELVPVVDLAGRVMRVRPPVGLFDLATERPERRRRRRENAGKRERRKPRPGAGEGGAAAPAAAAATAPSDA